MIAIYTRATRASRSRARRDYLRSGYMMVVAAKCLKLALIGSFGSVQTSDLCNNCICTALASAMLRLKSTSKTFPINNSRTAKHYAMPPNRGNTS